MPHASLGAEYFERLYAVDDDPWGFATSAYEWEKYADTVATLGGPYRRGLEIGCSIGVLTAALGERFERLIAVDVSTRALESARARCGFAENVRFEHMAFPYESPEGGFDAVVLSEVGYYWSDQDLALAKERISAVASGGVLELVHYVPKVDDYVRDGDAVHDVFLADPRFSMIRGHRAEKYRIDLLRVS